MRVEKSLSNTTAIPRKTPHKAEVVHLIGGGLSGCLLAKFLNKSHPSLKIHIYEKSAQAWPEKTWSFHKSDLKLPETDLRELISHEWPQYKVKFPNLTKIIPLPYCTLLPAKLITEIKKIPQVKFHTGVSKDRADFSADELVVESSVPVNSEKCGFQKFLGLHVKLKSPHGLPEPVLMDAQIPQEDGFRFMYVLPWSKDELLIEETHYSKNSDLPHEHYEKEILLYAKANGWDVQDILKKEKGVLPIPFNHSYVHPDENQALIGMGAGYFHAVTGYSLPIAVQVAQLLASQNLDESSFNFALQNLQKSRAGDDKFFELLNRLLFDAAPDTERYRVFEHFYKLPDKLIQAFYRGSLSTTQKFRFFVGRPPVPVKNALKTFFHSLENS